MPAPSIPSPGTLFVEDRGNGRFALVEIGRTKLKRGDGIELISHGECDERGENVEAFDGGPYTHEVPHGFCNQPCFKEVDLTDAGEGCHVLAGFVRRARARDVVRVAA
jgi:hypothetical protein